MAAALGVHRLRILSYFASEFPVGKPLSVVTPVGDVAAPADADTWLTSSLLADLVGNGRITADAATLWADSHIGQLYNEAVCGAGLLAATPGSLDRDVVVPLAHQSALAGVMLATSVVAAFVPELARQRPVAAEMRLDLLAGLPQVLPRPRNRTPGCLCADPVFFRAASADEDID